MLSKTENEAAVSALLPALDSPHQWIQEEVLRALMERRSPTGQREVLRRLHQVSDRWKEIVGRYQGRMSTALRDAVLGTDRQMCINGCQAILWFNEYDLMPVLISIAENKGAAEDQSHPHSDRVAVTLLDLAQQLHTEATGPRDYRIRRDPQLVRRHVLGSLELSIGRFMQHKRKEIVEAFLVLADRGNAVLKQILRDPHHACYLTLVEALAHSSRSGVMRLMLSFLDDPQAPSAALSAIAHRSDAKFLRLLLYKVGYSPSVPVAQNLKRVSTIPWFRGDLAVLDDLDERAQQGAVSMAMASGIKRQEVYHVVRHLLQKGNLGGRRAAAGALADFSGAEANALALATLDDPDPQVQAQVLGQLRQRGIPGAVSRLLEKVSSPHTVVREAVRKALSEFSFEKYLASFDMLDEASRQTTGALVRKIDPQLVPGLVREMQTPSRVRRMRALAVARATRTVRELEGQILELLADDDHMVRAEAAKSLALSDSATARPALTEALGDRSISVQEAARASLDQLEEAKTRQGVTEVWSRKEPTP
ncbi:MAG: HEAT repeat domain-containing protein [Pirellulales bacterium]